MSRHADYKLHPLNPKSTIENLSIVCYDEQLPETWEMTQMRIKALEKAGLIVFAIKHNKSKVNKIHYHFIVIVPKKSNGKANKMSVGAVLNALGIVFRDGLDDTLYCNNIQRLDKDIYPNLLYLLHWTQDKVDKYEIEDLVSNISMDDLRIYVLNGGIQQKNQQNEIEGIIFNALSDYGHFVLELMQLKGLCDVTPSIYGDYMQLTEGTKQQLLSEILHSDRQVIEVFDFGKWYVRYMTIHDLMSCSDFSDYANTVVAQITSYDFLTKDNKIVAMTSKYDYKPITNGLYLDLDRIINNMINEDNKITSILDDEVLDEAVDRHLSVALNACLNNYISVDLTVGDTIVKDQNEHEGANIAYLSNESKRAIFDVAFGEKMKNNAVYQGLNGQAFADKYIKDFDEFVSHYDVIGGLIQNKHTNTKEPIYLIAKDNGTYVDITVNAKAKFDKYVNRFGDKTARLYRFAQVLFGGSPKHYHYLCDDDINVGDIVDVKVNDEIVQVYVDTITQYTRANAPYNVDRCSRIIGKTQPISTRTYTDDDDDMFV